MKNRLFVNNNTIILFLFIIGSFLFIELNFRYWYRFLEQYMMFQTTGSYFQDRLAEPGGLNGSPDKPGGLSIQLCKSEKKEFYIRYSS